MRHSAIALLNTSLGRKIVNKHARKSGVPQELLEELVQAELDQVGKLRKRGLNDRFDEVLEQSFADEEK